MLPTIRVGEVVFVDEMAYRNERPKRGDLIVFRQGDYLLIKRVIALPGEQISVMNGQVLSINQQKLPPQKREGDGFVDDGATVPVYEEDLLGKHLRILKQDDYEVAEGLYAVTVPEDSYFVLGDYRSNSRDSRMFGAVPFSQIVGKVTYVVWPRTKDGGFDSSRVGKILE